MEVTKILGLQSATASANSLISVCVASASFWPSRLAGASGTTVATLYMVEDRLQPGLERAQRLRLQAREPLLGGDAGDEKIPLRVPYLAVAGDVGAGAVGGRGGRRRARRPRPHRSRAGPSAAATSEAVTQRRASARSSASLSRPGPGDQPQAGPR